MGKRWLLGLWFMAAILGIDLALANRASAAISAQQKKKFAEMAQSWLALLDKKQYNVAWEQAASYFRTGGSKDQWSAQITDGRRLVGEMLSRKLLEQYYTQYIPGAPVGQYYTMIFATSFSNKDSTIEMVFLVKDLDGKWRVGGYIVK